MRPGAGRSPARPHHRPYVRVRRRSLSPEQRREAERAETDERNIAIREKAAQSSFFWTQCLLWVPFVVALIEGSLLWILLSTGAIVLHNVFYLVILARWGRRL